MKKVLVGLFFFAILLSAVSSWLRSTLADDHPMRRWAFALSLLGAALILLAGGLAVRELIARRRAA